MTRRARQFTATTLAIGGYVVAAVLLLEPMSPSRSGIIGRLLLSGTLAVLSAAPILWGLLMGDLIPHWTGRVFALLVCLAAGMFGLLMLVTDGMDGDPGTDDRTFLARVLGQEEWSAYFAEVQFLHQVPALVVGECVVLVSFLSLWPWRRDGSASAVRDDSFVSSLAASAKNPR